MAKELNALIRDGLYRSGKLIWQLPIENLLRFGGLFIVAITVLGLPAVLLQFYRLNVPINFLSRTEALRAGVLPAIFLSVILLYLYWCAEQISKAGASPVGVVFALLPFFALMVLVLVGYLSFVVAIVWFMFSHERDIAGRQRFDWPILIAGGLAWLLLSLFRSKWAIERFAVVRQLASLPTRVKEVLENWFAKERVLGRSNVLLAAVMLAFIGGFVVVYGGFAGLTFAIHSHNTVLQGPVIFYAALVSGCLAAFLLLIAIFIGQLESSEDQRLHLRSAVTLTFGVLFFYVPSAVLYATVLYPRIPYGLGGGKPARATIWLEEAHFPDGWNPVSVGRLSKLSDVYLLQYDAERYIITPTDAPDGGAAIVVPTSTVKLLAAPPR